MTLIDIGAPTPIQIYREKGLTVLKQGTQSLRMGPITTLWLIDRMSEDFYGKKKLDDELGRVVLTIEKQFGHVWIIGKNTQFRFGTNHAIMVCEALRDVAKGFG